jgi:hypothetical protein
MSNKTKWKWIAQDKDGSIGKYSILPDLRSRGWYAEENEFALIDMGFSYEVNGWKESLINLETHDYKIINGVLIKVDKVEDIKWNWIAQDKDGKIYKYEDEPLIKTTSMFIADIGHQKLVQVGIEGLTKHDWKESLINLETHDYKIVDGILIRVDKQDKQQKHSHYKKDVRHLDYIDVYRIIELYELHDPCFQHALKKILVPGARGHKDLTKDINDIIDTMQRKLEMIAENEKKL